MELRLPPLSPSDRDELSALGADGRRSNRGKWPSLTTSVLLQSKRREAGSAPASLHGRWGPPSATARRLTPLPRASSFSFWRAARLAPGRHDSPRAGPARLSLSGGDATPVAYAAQSMLRRLFWWSGSCVLPAMIDRQRVCAFFGLRIGFAAWSGRSPFAFSALECFATSDCF